VPRARLLASAVAAATLLGATLAQAAAPPTGDADAIAFYHEHADAYSRAPGMTLVETGFFFMRPSANRSVDYWWGSKPPAGYVAATATVRAQLIGGKIVAYLAQLRAPRVRQLRILMAGGQVFTRTTSCWKKSPAGASPFGTGERYVFNDGGAHFAPRAGDAVTFTYPWVAGAKATETNAFTSREPSPVKISITVAGSRTLSIHKSIAPLGAAPSLPVPSPPARPAPKPMCPE
jgi:hypothetical protein